MEYLVYTGGHCPIPVTAESFKVTNNGDLVFYKFDSDPCRENVYGKTPHIAFAKGLWKTVEEDNKEEKNASKSK